MRPFSFPIALFLLIVPTIILGGATLYLLSHERDRIAAQSQRAAEFKARTIANEIAGIISVVQADLHDALLSMEELDPVTTLEQERNNNPLIRNVFLWQPETGLLHPSARRGMSLEEKRFVSRYERLFSSSVAWWQTRERASHESVDVSQMLSLKKQARLKISSSDADVEKGWETWFWEDRLFLLGWVRPSSLSAVRGVEVEMISLMSQILPQLRSFSEDLATYGILDHNGDLFHQLGGADITSALDEADIWVPVGSVLPQWRVAIFLDEPVGQVAGDRFFLIAACLLLLVVAAILLGGLNLLRDARRQFLDARQKSTFVSNVSHELKTPLTSIRMYAELLQQDRVQDPAKRRQMLEVIVDESHRLSRLVQNVLEFSRLEQGRKKYRLEETDVQDFVHRVLDQHGHRIADSGIAVQTRIPPNPVWCWVDRDALEQVVLNLVDNAIKYGRNPEQNELLLEVTAGDDHAVISVKDRGPGIPTKLSEKIFEKFFRVDESLTADRAGSGIGLSIARLLMRDMGGDLRYRPRTGGGSCFDIRIPILKEEEIHDI